MSTTAPNTLRVTGLGRQKLDRLAVKAKRLGMTTEKYVKQLVEEDLEISQDARTKSFAELMGPAAEVDEHEVDKLVEKAKAKHFAKTSLKTR